MCEGEILSLTWDCVDLEKKLFTLKQENTKNRPRKVPLSNDMVEMLKSLPGTSSINKYFSEKEDPLNQFGKPSWAR